MKIEWYLARYKEGKVIGYSPYALSRGEADNLLSLSKSISPQYSYKVVHESKLIII
jgi:hypothetical protein